MWNGFNPDDYIINKLMSKYFDIDETDAPDYVIGSVYSKEALKYDCIRILYTGENFCPDFNLYDYAIGFENLSYGDRYIYVPNYIMNPKYSLDVEKMMVKHIRREPSEKNEFCSFVVSNGDADCIREDFFKALSKYKKVNSGGRYMNNIGLPNGVPDKYEFQKKHKFSICFENSSHPGYITEKLIQGFSAGTVPIYFGATDIANIFNEDAMVIVKDKNDINRAIQEIIRIDNDDNLYERMINTPALKNQGYVKNIEHNLEKFLINIFSQPKELAFRRSTGQTVTNYYKSNCSNGGKNYLRLDNNRQVWKENNKTN